MNDPYEHEHGMPLNDAGGGQNQADLPEAAPLDAAAEIPAQPEPVHVLPPADGPSGFLPDTVSEIEQEVLITPPPQTPPATAPEVIIAEEAAADVIVTPPPVPPIPPAEPVSAAPAEPVVEAAAAAGAAGEAFRWTQTPGKSPLSEPSDDIKNYRIGQPKPSKYNQPRKPVGQKGAGGDKNGMAIASLVLGLLGIALLWVPYFGFLLPLLAVIFGIVGLSQATAVDRQDSGKGMAIAGIVLGLIGLAVAALILSVLGCVFDWVRSAFRF